MKGPNAKLPQDAQPENIITALLAGDRRALARAITIVENGPAGGGGSAGTGTIGASDILRETYKLTGRSYILGVTGPPGAGKSTLVDTFAKLLRAQGKTVGIVAVDPSSPFTGGAILGDRIRMNSIGTDPGIFIRSLATRGHLGGLSRAASDVVKVLDASGKDVIIVETVGVGQAEVEIAGLAHTTIVVVVPGMGDDVQAIKAGILEIGDVFVVNKADREGADRAVMELDVMLDLANRQGWRPPIVKTIANTGENVAAVVEAVERHRRHITDSGALERRRMTQGENEIRELVGRFAAARILAGAEESGDFAALAQRVATRGLDPYSAAEEILAKHGEAAGGQRNDGRE